MTETAEERRKRENKELIMRMKCGESLCHTPQSAYAWAPRPIIKKDEKAIKELFGK